MVGSPGQGAIITDRNPTLQGSTTLTWEFGLATFFPSKTPSGLAAAEGEAERRARERERANKLREQQVQFEEARDQYNRAGELLKLVCGDNEKRYEAKKELIESFHAARRAAIAFLELEDGDPVLLKEWIDLPPPFGPETSELRSSDRRQPSAVVPEWD